MKLGNYAHVSISVRSLSESIPFYEKLGFRKLWGNELPHPWALFTDGKLNIHLYESYFPSPALHYFSAHMRDKVLALLRIGMKAEQQKSRDGQRTQHSFVDPNDLGVTLMHHNDAEMPAPSGESHSLLGTFGELSISTEDLKTSIEFWGKLDFVPVHNGDKPYPWLILSDGVMTLGVHQTMTFTTPALTYYASDVAARIQSLKSESMEFKHELKNDNGETEGAIFNAPDGQTFFLLKGDV